MKSLLDIKKDALICAKKNNASNEIKCIKEKLKAEINGDRDIYLHYKIECERDSGYETVSFSFSVAAFILSFINFVQIFAQAAPAYSVTATFSENNFIGKFEVIDNGSWMGIIFAIMAILMTIIAARGSIKQMVKHEKYISMKVILQEIDEHWDEYFKKAD